LGSRREPNRVRHFPWGTAGPVWIVTFIEAGPIRLAGRPPLFPELEYRCIPVVTKSCLMDVIEMDLNTLIKLDSLVFESIGDYNAFGIVGAVGEIEESKSVNFDPVGVIKLLR
jgi:hypothetical protein